MTYFTCGDRGLQTAAAAHVYARHYMHTCPRIELKRRRRRRRRSD